MSSTPFQPTLNAALNATCAVFLLMGYLFIRLKKVLAHRFCMVSAFITSILFLTSYLTYHAMHGATRFPGSGAVRGIYLAILTSHTILAIVIVPLALRTFYLAWRRRYDAHRRIARWTLPVWLYVSVTGVIIYWMLYRVKWE